MSVSLSRCASFCSVNSGTSPHSRSPSNASPSCSPSPHKLRTPRNRNNTTQARHSRAASVAAAAAAASLVGAHHSPTKQHQQQHFTNAILSFAPSTASAAAAETPARRTPAPLLQNQAPATLPRSGQFITASAAAHSSPQRGPRKRVFSASERAFEQSQSSRATLTDSWTPRLRGRTSGSASEEDSGSDAGVADSSADLSPEQIFEARAPVTLSEDALRASAAFSMATGAQAGPSSMPAHQQQQQQLPHATPDARSLMRGRTATAFHDGNLERRFATHVSMTPPARFGGPVESPFGAGAFMATMPATEVRPQHHAAAAGIPRSHAFGSLVPLSSTADGAAEMERGHSWNGGMRRTCALPGSSRTRSQAYDEPDMDEDEDDGDEQGYLVPGPRPSHTRSKTESCMESTSLAASKSGNVGYRRGRAPSFLKPLREPNASTEMDVDTDSDADEAPPPSPSPMGDLAFPSRLGSTSSGEDDDCVLQPGARPPNQRRTGSRSMSVGQQHQPTQGLGLGLAFSATPSRSSTASSLKSAVSSSNTSTALGASSHTSSRSIASGAGSAAVPAMSSPYKTPHKRRAGQVERTRAVSTGSQASGDDGEALRVGSAASEGHLMGVQTLFGFSGTSSTPHESRSTDMLDRESKRRSTGSLHAGLAPSAGARLFGSAPPSKQGTPGSSTPARSNMPLAGRGATPASFARIHGSAGNTSDFDDSGIAFNTPPCSKEEALAHNVSLGKQLGLGLAMSRAQGSGLAITSTRKSQSADSLASPAKAKAARREANLGSSAPTAVHPFSVRERSSLANESKLSDGGSSAASSPDAMRRTSRNVSVPEGLGSPARHIPFGASSAASTGSLALPDDHHSPYLTPQNFKNAKPLATAFMSTGLVSKQRNRAPGDVVPPLPPNFSGTSAAAAAAASASAVSNSTSATALGLRDIVAAASAHAAAGPTNAMMPDTPMKPAPEPVYVKQQPPPSVLRPQPANILGLPRVRSRFALGSPTESTSSSSGASACGGDSPLLLDDACDSPTLNLVSVSTSADGLANAGFPGFTTMTSSLRRARSPTAPLGDDQLGQAFVPLSRTVSPPQGLALGAARPTPRTTSFGSSLDAAGSSSSSGTEGGVSPSVHAELAASRSPRPRKSRSKNNLKVSVPSATVGPSTQRAPSTSGSRGSVQLSAGSMGPHNPFARPPLLRSKTGSRPALGLHNKNSFGPQTSELFAGYNGLASPTFGNGVVPSTPTRSAGSIKWFEAAQLVTTPSPSSRRRASEAHAAKRGSISARLTKSSRLSQGDTSAASMPGKPLKRRGSKATAAPTSAEGAPAVGTPFETRFAVLSVLGQGEFSEAVKVEDKSNGCVYAVKRMKRAFQGPRDRARRMEEVDVLRHLSASGTGHPNVISLVDAWEEEGHLYVQTELCPLGTLAFFLECYGNLVGQLDEPRLWKVLAELAAGLQHIHGHGILHLDLKPTNVFITEIGTLKIGDFGLATRWPPAESTTTFNRRGGPNVEREGDREYLAPEIMFEARYSPAADIFSLGLIMLEAAGNVILPDNGDAWQKLRNDDVSDVDLSAFSVSLVRLIKSMICSDPQGRPSIEEVLAHPVVVAVRARMARGLLASELDQLPEFELPSADSSHSLQSVSADSDGDTDMDHRAIEEPETPTLTTYFGGTKMERSSSSSSALGLTGLPAGQSADEQRERVLDVRGALIQEPEEDFLSDVLGADPDPAARVKCENELPVWNTEQFENTSPMKFRAASSGGLDVGLGICAGDDDDEDAETSASAFAMHFEQATPQKWGERTHASFAASPLRHAHAAGGAHSHLAGSRLAHDAMDFDMAEDEDDIFSEPASAL